MRPALVGHADWSAGPKKRWLAAAVMRADGRYRLAPTVRVGPLDDFWRSFNETGERALLGFDFPLGLPRAYAERAGIDDFVAVLPRLGEGRWRQFYDVATRPAEIDLDFGTGADGEDRFDAVVGLLGMLNVVLGRRPSGEPDDPTVRRIEGWILGQRVD